MTAKLLLPRGERAMQITIFPHNGKWVWTLSEQDAQGNVEVLTKPGVKYHSQRDCEVVVERVKAGFARGMKVVVLGEES